MDDAFRGVAAALDAIDGLETLEEELEGNPIPDAQATLYLRCELESPAREELLAKVSPLVRKATFVLAALVDRRNHYALSFVPGKRKKTLEDCAAKLEALLRDRSALESGEVPDRRGRV